MSNNSTPRDEDDTTPEVDTETAQAEANIAAALTGEVDPYAFLAGFTADAPVAYVKAPPVETDIPLALRTLVEKTLESGTAQRVTFPTASLVKPALKFFKAYALCRIAGKIVIRAGIQRDGVTVHLTVKHPTVKPAVAV